MAGAQTAAAAAAATTIRHPEVWQWLAALPTPNPIPPLPPAASSTAFARLLAQCQRCEFGDALKESHVAQELLRPFIDAATAGSVKARAAAEAEGSSPIDFSKVELDTVLQQLLLSASRDKGKGRRQETALEALLVAFAALSSFVQLNWTGPELGFTSAGDLLRLVPSSPPPPSSASSPNGSAQEKPPTEATAAAAAAAAVHDASVSALTWRGEPAYHLCAEPFLLLFAVRVVRALRARFGPAGAATRDAGAEEGEVQKAEADEEERGEKEEEEEEEETAHLISWIDLRAALVHNRALDEQVALDQAEFLAPIDRAIAFVRRSSSSSPGPDAHSSGTESPSQDRDREHRDATWPASALAARLVLERGLASQQAHGAQDNRAAAARFVEAARLARFAYLLSGALGKRTRFQREDRTQLVLLARSDAQALRAERGMKSALEALEGGGGPEGEKEKEKGETEEERKARKDKEALESGWQAKVKEDADKSMPADFQLNDDTLLEQTEFTSTSNATSTSTSTSPAGVDSAEAELLALDAGNQPELTSFDQAILLALSLNIRDTSPAHGLTSEQIGAFVARVLQHPTNWSVYTMALLLRSRLEATRTRTVERSVLQLQALLDQMPTSDSSARERLRLVWQLELPARWEMQAELARRYASIGVVRSAMEIYERIERWEEVVQCLGSLGRHEEGIELVRELLQGKKVEVDAALAMKRKDQSQSQSQSAASDADADAQSKPLVAAVAAKRTREDAARQAKYWCLLGDLEPSRAAEHYGEAWRVSAGTSGRAARSLGGVHFARGEYAATAEWLRTALAINPLLTRTWFILGCAHMRLEQFGPAAECFRRCTNLDEEDGESWNNLASCYLRLGQEGAENLMQKRADGKDSLPQLSASRKSESQGQTSAPNGTRATELQELSLDDDDDDDKQALVGSSGATRSETSLALRKLAHRALAQSLKLKRGSWRVWYNYMVVSVDVGDLKEAARALGRVVEIRTSAGAGAGSADAQGGGGGGGGGEGVVDFDVLQRLVQAVAQGRQLDREIEQERRQEKQQLLEPGGASPAVEVEVYATEAQAEARALQRSVELLFDSVLLRRVSSGAGSERLWQLYGKLQLCKGERRRCLEAQLAAWKASAAGDAGREAELLSDKGKWGEAVQMLRETVELLQNLGERSASDELEEMAMSDWRFKARSLVRGFMARCREAYGEEPEWERLEELKRELV